MLMNTVAGFGATYEFSHAAPGAEVFLPAIVPWITSFIALTLSTNVVCTSKYHTLLSMVSIHLP